MPIEFICTFYKGDRLHHALQQFKTLWWWDDNWINYKGDLPTAMRPAWPRNSACRERERRRWAKDLGESWQQQWGWRIDIGRERALENPRIALPATLALSHPNAKSQPTWLPKQNISLFAVLRVVVRVSYIFFNQSTGPSVVEESDWVLTWLEYKHGLILLLEQMTAFVSLKSLIVSIQK